MPNFATCSIRPSEVPKWPSVWLPLMVTRTEVKRTSLIFWLKRSSRWNVFATRVGLFLHVMLPSELCAKIKRGTYKNSDAGFQSGFPTTTLSPERNL